MNERDIAEGQAAREWYFNRFGVDETQPAQDDVAKPEKPRVETVYRGDQPVTVFKVTERYHGHEQANIPEFIEPLVEHFTDARKLDLAVEAINRVSDDGLYTQRRSLIRSLAYRLANPNVPLEEIAQQGRLQLEVFKEDLKKASEAFQWATNVLGINNHPKGQIKD